MKCRSLVVVVVFFHQLWRGFGVAQMIQRQARDGNITGWKMLGTNQGNEVTRSLSGNVPPQIAEPLCAGPATKWKLVRAT